jgi:predicted dehydrogenase
MSRSCTFGIVGQAWRAEYLVRVAQRFPDHLTLVGAGVRRPEAVEEVNQRWGVRAFLSPEELVRKLHPDFVITAVPRAANPTIVTELVEMGAAVLTETPPAGDVAGLHALWDAVGRRLRVQVAEQYLLYPGHVARRRLVERGVIGVPTSVQVSSTHGYHAVSMIRGMLGVGFGPATVSASVFSAPLVDPLTRQGWTEDDNPRSAKTTLATLDFGGTSGLYDFTDNQWHNQLRHRRIVIRGSHGEIADDNVVHLAAPRTILSSPLLRSQLGYDLSLDGYDTEHISFEGQVVYQNPFLGLRLMDDEIAVADLLAGTAAWLRDEAPAPYPLADGCQDQLISLAIDEAVATGGRVVTGVEPWASA